MSLLRKKNWKRRILFQKRFQPIVYFFIFHADHPNADWMFLITIKVFLITLKIKENHLFPLYVHGLNEMLNEREYYMRKKHKIVFVVFDSLITLYILCFIAFVFYSKKSYEKMCNEQSIKDVFLLLFIFNFCQLLTPFLFSNVAVIWLI